MIRVGRLAAIVAAVLLATPAGARDATMPLAELAGHINNGFLPSTVATSPEEITIDAALRDRLLTLPLDGGREQNFYLRFDPAAATLTFDRAVMGARYRATGVCDDCDYPQPVQGHTHPYENPFSVLDLIIAGRTNRASLMAARDGRLWLAVPTSGSREVAIEEWREFRYALFGNRLQCPARTPPGGWASATAMGRNVEIVARAAAHDLKVALYVLDPGKGAFRKLPNFDHGEPLFDIDRRFEAADLNAYEITLLRTLTLASATREGAEGPWLNRESEIDPRGPSPRLDAELNAAVDESDPPEIQGAPRNTANIASDARRYWFRPLPTTIYRASFADLSKPAVPFVSVQLSRDCRHVMVLQGEQGFAPDGVVYSRGWRRARTGGGAWNEGWTEMTPGAFPAGQVVPW